MPVSLLVFLLIVLLPASAFADERYIVQFKDTSPSLQSATTRSQMVSAAGGKVELDLPGINSIAATLNDAQVAALQADPNVEFVEVDQKRYPMAQEVPYGITMVQADLLSDAAAGGKTVCIIDSGYDITHPDLAVNQVSGLNVPNTGDWFVDGDGHGTHVAGTISALNNSLGVVGVMGSGTVNLYIVKVFGDTGFWSYTSDIIDAIAICQDAGTDVVNMSLGGEWSSLAEEAAMNQFNQDGMLLVAAAGNRGNKSRFFPASYDSVVSVGAVDSSKNVADFSNKNSKVEIVAPGVDVVSTMPESLELMAATLEACTEGVCSAMSAEVFAGVGPGFASGEPIDCGTGATPCEESPAGKICVFEDSPPYNDYFWLTEDCWLQGGVGAVVYNNSEGTIDTEVGFSRIPFVGALQSAGPELLASDLITIDIVPMSSLDSGTYGVLDGTSMATPHVSGGAALLWSNYPECSNNDIRNAINLSAEDLGDPGRDIRFGYGLLQLQAAHDYLNISGCVGSSVPISLLGLYKDGLVQLQWLGSGGSTVDVYIDGVHRKTIDDGGSLSLPGDRWLGKSVDFSVCNTDGSSCSNTVPVSLAGIHLSGVYKDGLIQLRWSGSSPTFGSTIDVYIDGVNRKTIDDHGSTSLPGTRWSGETVIFSVCTSDGASCSRNEAISVSAD